MGQLLSSKPEKKYRELRGSHKSKGDRLGWSSAELSESLPVSNIILRGVIMERKDHFLSYTGKLLVD